MTPSGPSRVSGSSVGRRSLLLSGGGAAAALALGNSGTAAASQRAESSTPTFDFDTDNFIEFVQPSDENAGVSPAAAVFAPMDLTIFLWINHLSTVAWFDAVAPYHETAVGVYTRVPRRPSSESATNRNMNIALFHSWYQVAKAVVPERVPALRKMMSDFGLNPDDESVDKTSPVGIGNLAGKGVIEARKHDGMNMLGDEGGREFNPMPYADYTGYQPVNSPYKLVNPSRWQPLVVSHRRRVGPGPYDMGAYTVQSHLNPQVARVKPYSFSDPSEFPLAPPRHSDHTNMRAYKRSVDEVIEVSANLTDRQKVLAEVFDNKVWGIGHSTIVVARRHKEMGVHDWAHFFLIHLLSTFEPTIAAFHYKMKYDAVRPISAIRHVYGNKKLTAWGGPGMGTVNNIPASQWNSYLGTPDHTEYPSGSTTLCSAEAQAARRFFGDDVLDWKFTIPAGKALVEPGVTPARDLELHWATWTEFVKDCAMSRVWAGVHFRKTVEQSVLFGEQFGDMAYEFVMRQVRGEVKN